MQEYWNIPHSIYYTVIHGAYTMKKKNYKSIFSKFKKEIKDTKSHVFHDVDS